MVRVRRISTTDPLYRQQCALREEVLLRPIGLDMARFRAEFPGVEEQLEHYVATVEQTNGPRVIGCASLLVASPESGRLMQMAVDLQRQGEGVGRRLVVAIESRAFGELRLRELYCHAQLAAVGFFLSLGWTPAGDVFHEAGLAHRRMTLQSPEVPDDAPEPTPEE
ncbi:MAG: GNAT family N-acetyltransferase [Phycisphaerae bacterium]|nr:GNAT family N-acetyltransferase [Phycisphaerae bacterium]